MYIHNVRFNICSFYLSLNRRLSNSKYGPLTDITTNVILQQINTHKLNKNYNHCVKLNNTHDLSSAISCIRD